MGARQMSFWRMFLIIAASTRAQVAGISWAWTPSNTVVNQLRFGYNSFWQQIFSGDHSVPASTFGIETGVTDPLNLGMPQIRVSGFNNLGGNSSWPLLTTPNRTWQITDTVVQSKGRHNLKYGGEFRTGSTDTVRNTYGKGRVDFRGLDLRIQAAPPQDAAAFLGGFPTQGAVARDLGFAGVERHFEVALTIG